MYHLYLRKKNSMIGSVLHDGRILLEYSCYLFHPVHTFWICFHEEKCQWAIITNEPQQCNGALNISGTRFSLDLCSKHSEHFKSSTSVNSATFISVNLTLNDQICKFWCSASRFLDQRLQISFYSFCLELLCLFVPFQFSVWLNCRTSFCSPCTKYYSFCKTLHF